MLGGGVGTAQFFSERGTRVLVTDLKSKDELKSSLDRLADYPIEYVLGEIKTLSKRIWSSEILRYPKIQNIFKLPVIIMFPLKWLKVSF